MPTNTTAITASENTTVTASSFSPSTGTANNSARNGCTSCTWLTRTVPPSARPRYQAKKPSHIENSVTYAKPPHALALTGAAGQVASATGNVNGRLSTNTQQITCSAGNSPATRAPAT